MPTQSNTLNQSRDGGEMGGHEGMFISLEPKQTRLLEAQKIEPRMLVALSQGNERQWYDADDVRESENRRDEKQ
jgi:hypothetical protein